MSHTCKKCKSDKTAAEMVVRAGKPSQTCKACFKASFGSGRSGGGSKVSSRKQLAVVKAAPAIAPLEIQQGYGIKSHIDEPYLFIEQSDGEGHLDTVCLSRAEWRALVLHFGAWAG